jgi:hypothetical protein
MSEKDGGATLASSPPRGRGDGIRGAPSVSRSSSVSSIAAAPGYETNLLGFWGRNDGSVDGGVRGGLSVSRAVAGCFGGSDGCQEGKCGEGRKWEEKRRWSCDLLMGPKLRPS